MDTVQTRRYEMLVRVRDFGEAHGDRFPKQSAAREQFTAVADAVTQLGAHAVSKMTAAREGAASKSAARKALIDALEAVSRTGRIIATSVEGLDDKFQLPATRTSQACITAGRVFARDAEAFTAEFVTHGMPKTFVRDLRALVDQFESAIHERQAGKDEHVAARASIRKAIADGNAAVEKLDVILANELRGDAVTMAVWTRDRKVIYPNRDRRTEKRRKPVKAEAVPAAALAAVPAPELTPKTS